MKSKQLKFSSYLSRDEASAFANLAVLQFNLKSGNASCVYCGGDGAQMEFNSETLTIKTNGCCEAAITDAKKKFENDWKLIHARK